MKYHIFIGSGLDDLKNERREIPQIIAALGHVPVMGEYIDASGKNGAALLQKTIEECDYFVAIVAHKYAAAGEEAGASRLEAEYDFALAKGIPAVSLVINERARWSAGKREKDAALAEKLERFKEKLCAGVCETWFNSTDLYRKLQDLLIWQMNFNPQKGWLRADFAPAPAVANEFARLSAENERFRLMLKIEGGDLSVMSQDQLEQSLGLLAANKITLSFYYAAGESWENGRPFRYLRIFKLLVPELTKGKTAMEISRFLGAVLNPERSKTVRKDYPVPSNTVKKIMHDFSLLKLVKCAPGPEELWEISEPGKELYSAYRIKQLEKMLGKKG
ncbi:MAG: DUF4062 domain-containing protein [Spirochaetes bacterium]|nr:DUF4062 domain-containing protein [Spirochaetota bacterium]